jgi:hypothetical protein
MLYLLHPLLRRILSHLVALLSAYAKFITTLSIPIRAPEAAFFMGRSAPASAVAGQRVLDAMVKEGVDLTVWAEVLSTLSKGKHISCCSQLTPQPLGQRMQIRAPPFLSWTLGRFRRFSNRCFNTSLPRPRSSSPRRRRRSGMARHARSSATVPPPSVIVVGHVPSWLSTTSCVVESPRHGLRGAAHGLQAACVVARGSGRISRRRQFYGGS